MRYLFYYSMHIFSIACAADRGFCPLPRQHLSLYDTDYNSMTAHQLGEKSQKIRSEKEARDERWLDEKSWRRTIKCMGVHCCFWVPSSVISAVEFSSHSIAPAAGIGGFFVGAYAVHLFSDWYRPNQSHRERALRDIDRVLQEKKLKQD